MKLIKQCYFHDLIFFSYFLKLSYGNTASTYDDCQIILDVSATMGHSSEPDFSNGWCGRGTNSTLTPTKWYDDVVSKADSKKCEHKFRFVDTPTEGGIWLKPMVDYKSSTSNNNDFSNVMFSLERKESETSYNDDGVCKAVSSTPPEENRREYWPKAFVEPTVWICDIESGDQINLETCFQDKTTTSKMCLLLSRGKNAPYVEYKLHLSQSDCVSGRCIVRVFFM